MPNSSALVIHSIESVAGSGRPHASVGRRHETLRNALHMARPALVMEQVQCGRRGGKPLGSMAHQTAQRNWCAPHTV